MYGYTHYNAFKDIIGPLHHEMSNNNISPRVAGEQFSLLLGTFLESHPGFVAHEASDKYQQHEGGFWRNHALGNCYSLPC